MTTTYYADDLLAELQANGRIPLRQLPKVLGAALARRISKGQLPNDWKPPRWDEKPGTLANVPFFQRLIARTLPERSVRKFRVALRLALSEELGREIASLEFRHAASQTVAPPASTFLADVFSLRQKDESLSSRLFSIVLSELRLGLKLPQAPRSPRSTAHSTLKDANVVKPLPLSLIRTFEDRNFAASHLTFARFSRLIAEGIHHGMRVRVLIDPNLSRADETTPSPEHMKTAVFRLGLLMALRDLNYGDRRLGQLTVDPLLDAAAYAHLRLTRDDTTTRLAVEERYPAAFQRAENHFMVKILPRSKTGPGLSDLVRRIPGLRVLLETSPSPRDYKATRAFLWLRLHGDDAEGDPERLIQLEDKTSTELADHVDSLWSEATELEKARC